MTDLNPVRPHRPLMWPDFVYELHELLLTVSRPVYIVGGAVRDALLHRPLHDIDLATPSDAVRLARQIANHFSGDVFVLDAERDVARVLLAVPEGRLTLDVAALRGASLIDDLYDRDFTVNAMAVDAKGNLELLLDPLGGETDIRSKLLRRCTPAALSSDPIRALRAVRQSIQLSLRIEAETLFDVRAAVNELEKVSQERVRDELFKIFSLPRPAAAFRVVDSLGLVRAVLPELMRLHGSHQLPPHLLVGWQQMLAVVENLSNIFAVINYARTDNTASSFSLGMIVIQLDRYRKRLLEHLSTSWPNERPHQSLLILAGVLHNSSNVANTQASEAVIHSAAVAKEVGLRLRLSNDEIVRLVLVVQNYRLLFNLEDTTPLTIYRYWRELDEAGIDVCLLALAYYLGTNITHLEQNVWLHLVERVRVLLEAWYEKHGSLVSPPVLLDGYILMKSLSLRPGPIIGELLERIREAQVTGEVRSLEDALEFARTALENNR